MSSSGSQGKQPVPGLVETVNQNHHQEETDEMAEALGSLDLTSYTCEQVSNWAEKKEVIEHKPELNSGGSNEANSPGAADSNILSNSVESSSHVAGKTNKEDNSPTATESEIDPDSSAESEIDSDSSAESPEDSSSLNDGLLQSSPASHSCFGASQPSTMQCSQGTAQALPPSNSRLQAEKSLNCPRCNSTNTKFCYYNNYSLQQPRYFCKTCRRYWTEGGSLRNVPVGGGSRKNKRSSSSSSSSTSPAPASLPVGVGPTMGQHQDINLALLPHHHHGRGPNPGALSEPPRSTSYLPPPLVSPGMPIEHGADLWSALSEVRRWSPLQVPSALGPTMNTHDSESDGAWLTPGLRGVTRESAGGRFLFPFEFLKPAMSADDGGANDGARESATGRLFFPFEDGDVLPPVASADGGASDDGNNGAEGRMLDDGGERVQGESAADKGSDNGGGGRAD